MLGLGITLALVCSVSGTIGKLLLRHSALQKHAGNKNSATLSKTLGILFQFILGPILDGLSRMFAPQSVIAPFGGLQLVWNIVLAPFLLGERVTATRIGGCVLITISLFMFAFLSIGRVDPKYTIEYLEGRLYRMPVFLYIVGFSLWVWFNVSVLLRRPEGDRLRGLSFGLLGGTVAGNMFCLKATLELVETSIAQKNAAVFFHPLCYAMIVGAAGFGISNAKLLTRGMAEFDALFMSAIFCAAAIVGQFLSGAVILGDFESLSTDVTLMNVLGLALIVIAVVVLAVGEESRSLSGARTAKAARRRLSPAPMNVT